MNPAEAVPVGSNIGSPTVPTIPPIPADVYAQLNLKPKVCPLYGFRAVQVLPSATPGANVEVTVLQADEEYVVIVADEICVVESVVQVSFK